jgi:ABC-type lipoprotein export system ATPase subunit
VNPLRAGADVLVDAVTKTFEGGRISALAEASMRLEPGEFVALTGPSGSGKSTLLNLIGALDRPDAGTIMVDGRDLASVDDLAGYRSSTVGFVFQLHNLIATLTALENVEVPMIGRGLRRDERERRAQALLGEVGLAARSGSAPSVLSGGERQRVAIARALANHPRLLLADEPTGALDFETGLQIVALLQRLREQRRMTTLLVTNDDAIARHADRILRLRDGRVETVTPAAEPEPA